MNTSTPRPNRLSLLLGFALGISAPLAVATEIVWTNLSGGNWNTAANWSPNTVPSGAAHVAIITNAGTYSVTNNGSRTLGGLVLGGPSGAQRVAQRAAYTMTLHGSGLIGTNGHLDLVDGTFTGTNLVTLDGLMSWDGVSVGSSSQTAIQITPQGRLNLVLASGKFFYGTLTNGGTIVWSGGGQFNQYGTLHNLPAGLIDAQTNSLMNSSSTSLLVNQGTIRKSGGTGNTDIEPLLVNTGTFEAQTGAIRFTGQGKTFAAGTRFTGVGTNLLMALSSGQPLQFTGAVTSENLQLAGGALAGAGVMSGTMSWTSGNIASGSSLTVAAGGVLQISGATTKYAYGALTNAGQVIWDSTASLYSYDVIHNQSGAVFEARSDAILNYTSGSPVFINDGTFRKAASAGTTTVQVGFLNNGTVDTQTGTLRFDTQPKTFNGGCHFTGAGIALLYAGCTVTLAGNVSSENLQLGGATLDGTGSLSGTATWTLGSVAATGRITVATDGVVHLIGAGTKYVAGVLTNAGQIVWSDTGDIQPTGIIHNLVGGVFEARNDAVLDYTTGAPVFVNDGVFRKTLATGLTSIQVAFINNGAVDTQTGTVQFNTQPKTFNHGCRFTGAGVAHIYTSCTANLSGTIDSENLVLGGGTLAGVGGVNGSFTWNSGTLSPDVSFNVTTNGLLLLASSGNKILNGTITNAGIVRWTGTGNLTVRGVVHNRAGGLFEMLNDELLDYVSGSPQFINDGVVRKQTATGTTLFQISLINNGTVDVKSGVVQLYVQPKTFNAGCRFTGAGVCRMDPGMTVTLAGEIQSENLVLNGASITGAGGVTGSFTWNSGTLTPDVSFTVPTNGLLLLASSGNKDLNGTITNAGTVRWTGTGNLRLRGAMHNQSTGLIDVQNNELLDFVTGTPVIINEGSFRKSIGTGTTTCQIPFTNLGRIEVNSGTLLFSSTGLFTDLGGTIALAGGMFQTPRPLDLIGTLSGYGTVRPHTGSTATLTNHGVINPAPAGVLRVEGHLRQQLAGTLNFALGGTAPGTNHSRLDITGDADLTGTLGVTLAGGYLPNPGDTFNVMTFKSRSGDFACFNGMLFLGQNRRLVTQWGATNLALVTINAPDPTNVAPRITARYPSAIVCWPAEFLGCTLYSNTNLSTTNWTLLPGVTNAWFEPVMAPEKYFRLRIP